MTQMEKIDALVLKTVHFRERDRIVTFFSREKGIIKALAFGANSAKSEKRALTDLLTRGEYILRQGRGELLTLVEGKGLDHHFALRSDFERLEVATQIAQLLLRTQQELKAATPLYDLCTLLLRELGQAQRPTNLLALFHLKLLKYEGVLSLRHLPFPTNDQERHILEALSNAKNLQGALSLSLPSTLLKKIEGLTLLFSEQ